jgi:hypothetical protein
MRVTTAAAKIGPLMICRVVLIGILCLTSADLALASWWIVRAADERCLVVDIEPKDNDKSVTKVGKGVYRTAEEAEADVKEFCKGAKPDDEPPVEPGNPQ